MRSSAFLKSFLAGMTALWSIDLIACGGMMVPETGVEILGSKIRSLGGQLTAEEVEVTTYQNVVDIEFCYDKLLTANKDARGMLMTTVTINGQGKVSNVRLNTRMTRDPHFENCVKSALQRWTFEKPRNGKDVVTSTVFRFDPDYRSLPEVMDSDNGVMLSNVGKFGK